MLKSNKTCKREEIRTGKAMLSALADARQVIAVIMLRETQTSSQQLGADRGGRGLCCLQSTVERIIGHLSSLAECWGGESMMLQMFTISPDVVGAYIFGCL